jgi:hypothetical protein
MLRERKKRPDGCTPQASREMTIMISPTLIIETAKPRKLDQQRDSGLHNIFIGAVRAARWKR